KLNPSTIGFDESTGHIGEVTVRIVRAMDAPRDFGLDHLVPTRPWVVAGRVVSTRATEHWRKVMANLPDAVLNADTVTLDGVAVRQPFAWLRPLLEDKVRRVTGLTHGDLNPRNILLLNGQIFLIDFT